MNATVECVLRHLADGSTAAARRACAPLIADPESRARGLALLAAIARRDGQIELAAELYEGARQLASGHPASRLEVATLFGLDDESDSIPDDAREVLRSSPDHPLAHLTLARRHERLNDLEAARSSLDAVLAKWPNRIEARVLEVRVERRLGNLRKAVRRGQALLRNGLAAEDQRRLHFELGKALERLGEDELAFRHFEESNQLHRSLYGRADWSSSGIARYIDSWNECLAREWVEGWTPIERDETSEEPVFLVGFPRSGTTLIHQILACHAGVDLLEERPCLRALERRIEAAGTGLPAGLAALEHETATALRREYEARVSSYLDRRPGALLIDKLPMHLVRAGTIHRLFPGARFLFVARRPADVCFSAWAQLFSDGDLVRHFTTLEDTVRLYDRSLRLWNAFRRLLSLNVHVIRYEDLIRDPEGELRRLLEALGLSWDPQVLRHASGPDRHRFVRTPSYSQVSQPLYSRSVERWRRFEHHLTPFRETLRPHETELGYEESPSNGAYR